MSETVTLPEIPVNRQWEIMRGFCDGMPESLVLTNCDFAIWKAEVAFWDSLKDIPACMSKRDIGLKNRGCGCF